MDTETYTMRLFWRDWYDRRNRMPDTILKKAIDLQPGDEVVRDPDSFPSTFYAGTVARTVVVDRGVQIVLKDGSHYARPENYLLETRA